MKGYRGTSKRASFSAITFLEREIDFGIIQKIDFTHAMEEFCCYRPSFALTSSAL
jgi:hypothetical protein